MHSVIVAITGASGAVYGVRLLQVLLQAGHTVHLSISGSGQAVLREELGVTIDLKRFSCADLFATATSPQAELALDSPLGRDAMDLLEFHHPDNMLAPIASGSYPTRGMVIVPCSGTTLSAVAHAQSGNLIQRAAEVQLTERRKLIMVPREAPLSTLQIENLLRVSRAGAVVLPGSPGWYHGVNSLRDLVDFIVARICDQLGVETELIRRWGTEE